MSSPIVNRKLQDYRSDLDSLLQRVQQLAADSNNPELQATTDSLRKNINEPFLFVVVGEVKAGKSSFVNALLEATVCRTDIEPCTDSIQQIVYAEQPFERQIEPNLRKIGLPIEILQEISIVDTPGTNTIVADHQIVTERYIPNSDLTFFVLFAKNPYQKSAWDFLDFVSAQWRKKVVFILQQSDLLKPADLETNVERVKDYARQKQIAAPLVFATSAERELNGEENSGFAEIRDYILEMVSSGSSYKIKLRSVSDTTQKIIEALADDVRALGVQLAADKKTVENIKTKIDAGRKRSRFEIKTLVERLSDRYDSISSRIKLEFRDSLSVMTVIRRSFVGIFKKEASMQAWITDFKERCQTDLKISLEELSSEGAQHFVDGIRHLLESLTQDINNVQTHQIESSSISIAILERRQEVIESIKSKVEQLLTDEGLVSTLNANAEDMAVEIVGGIFVTIAGTILNVLEFAVAEAIMNAIGIAFAGIGVVLFAVGIAWQRNHIIRKFESALDREQGKFNSDVTDRLHQKLGLIYEEVERIFVQFYDYVEREEQAIAPIVEQYEAIQADARQLFGKKL
ncbi:dynamin family protein [Lusitaniella coriacea LEGE 07157]|uniref:Dynamin family protein n=1 Tax=Lusitaniella coriacea LEGE 07157 TaxID=945747 RepID=A0A8J7AS71_9CYAN|nr:dynamin family protein [Lusitaniella coriacea]MBE9115316.1 dynamin family protein [Lusitaniella coriacea LEGE 07157]